MDCSALFTEVPTDIGMCCALNTADIFRKSEYADLVTQLQREEAAGGGRRRAKAAAGKKKGLRLVLDLHSNMETFGSVYNEWRGFKLFIGQPQEFPALLQRHHPVKVLG